MLILAATPALFDSVRDRDKPWFGGLIETPVDGLTAAEGRELLSRLARDCGDQLAEGASAAMPASEIAAETGLSQQTVSSALGLLKEGRWIRDEKLPKGDQRLTWYSLREPMLRHHFQWRATEGEPLRLIVDLLREWYDPTELRRNLSLVEPASPGEAYLAESLLDNPPGYDLAITAGTPDALLAVAREWMRGGDPVYPAESGLYAELCVTLTRDPAADGAALVRRRREQHPHLQIPPDETVASLAAEASAGAELSGLLQTAAWIATGDVAASLTLLAAGLMGRQAQRRSHELLAAADADPGSALGLAITLDGAFWASEAGDVCESLRVVSSLLPAIESALGPKDRITLTARSNLAQYTGEAGDTAEALRLYRELLPDLVRVLGPDDRGTLTTRHQVAYYTGALRDAAHALRLYQELLPDIERAREIEDPLTVSTRTQIQYWARRATDPSGITKRLGRARAGDQEARMRLPAELRPLADGPEGASWRIA